MNDGGVASVRFDVDASDALLIYAGGFEAACGDILDITASFRRQAASYGVVMYLLCIDTGLYWSVVDHDWRPLEADIITTGGGREPPAQERRPNGCAAAHRLSAAQRGFAGAQASLRAPRDAATSSATPGVVRARCGGSGGGSPRSRAAPEFTSGAA